MMIITLNIIINIPIISGSIITIWRNEGMGRLSATNGKAAKATTLTAFTYIADTWSKKDAALVQLDFLQFRLDPTSWIRSESTKRNISAARTSSNQKNNTSVDASGALNANMFMAFPTGSRKQQTVSSPRWHYWMSTEPGIA